MRTVYIVALGLWASQAGAQDDICIGPNQPQPFCDCQRDLGRCGAINLPVTPPQTPEDQALAICNNHHSSDYLIGPSMVLPDQPRPADEPQENLMFERKFAQICGDLSRKMVERFLKESEAREEAKDALDLAEIQRLLKEPK